jgi:hypothetical protein
MATNFMKYNRKNLNLLLIITGISLATTWLPFLRGMMDGETYTWGTSLFGFVFSGRGTSGDYYYVVLNLVFCLLLLYAFYWISRRVIFYSLLILWHGVMIANIFYEAFWGEGFVFNGDTMNIHINLSYIILPVMMLIGFLIVRVIRTDLKFTMHPEWTRRNTNWAMVLLLPLFVQAYLFREGEPHGLTDKIGVVIALLQVLFVTMPFKAYKFKPE